MLELTGVLGMLSLELSVMRQSNAGVVVGEEQVGSVSVLIAGF